MSPRPTAIVTGAGSGIGAAIATRLAIGHDLLLTHLRPGDDIDQVLTDCRALGADTTVVTGDLTDLRVRTELGTRITDRAAAPQVVVSNAGAYPRVPWTDTTEDVFARQIEVNLTTYAALAHAVTAALTGAGSHGRFVAISSVLSQLGRVDLAGYLAAKAGLEGLIRADGIVCDTHRARSSP